MKSFGNKVFRVVLSAMPFVIIGGLLGAVFFIKPKANGMSIEPPPIERRDHFYGVLAPEKDVIWAAGSLGKVVRSEDDGKSWKEQATPSTHHLQDIAAWDALRAVCVGNQGVVIVTLDGGKTWKEVKAPRSEVANKLMRVKAYPEGVAWAVGEMGAVLCSADYGQTWTRRSKEEDVGWNDVAFVDPKNGLVVGEFGRMLRTSDGGNTWKPSGSPAKSSLLAVAFRDGSSGVAVGMEGLTLSTSDGGRTWKTAAPVTKVHLFDVTWGGDKWFAVGGKGALLTGDASGMKWTAGRLAETDLAWHTKIVRGKKGFYAAGANLGSLRDGKWEIFRTSAQK